jgi:hypothetical protein
MSIVLKVCFRKNGKEFEVQIIPDEPLLFLMKMGEHFTSYQLDSDESDNLLSFIAMYGKKPKSLPVIVSDNELGLKHQTVEPSEPVEQNEPAQGDHQISREDLSTRAYHVILKAHLASWESVHNTENRILQNHGAGKKTLDEIRGKQFAILGE